MPHFNNKKASGGGFLLLNKDFLKNLFNSQKITSREG